MALPDDYRALRDTAGLLDRTESRGRLRLTGADRRAYLQGLLTNDVAALTPGTGCYTAYLTAQGRMIADMRVFELGDALLVDLEHDLTEPVRTRWEQFIFSEDVRVESLSSSTAQIAVYGPRAADAVESAFAVAHVPGEIPPSSQTIREMPIHGNARWDFRGEPAFVLRTDDLGGEGVEIVLPRDRKGALVELLTSAGARAVSAEAAEVCRVEAGRPRFHADMNEDTIPLEAGIEDRAISLTKGCYVGQEIIIRVLHRGHGRVARKLVGLSFDPSAAVPVQGAQVWSGDREVGAVTSAVRSPALERPIALALLHRDFVQPGTRVSVGGAPAEVAALPFAGAR